MKKIITILTISLIIFILIFFMQIAYKSIKVGNNITKSSNDLIEYILNISSYEAKIEVTINSNKTTNKYVVEQLPMTLTHPKEVHRAAAVEFARECMCKYAWHDMDSAMMGLPAFVYGRQKQLNEELIQCAKDMKEKKMYICQVNPLQLRIYLIITY